MKPCGRSWPLGNAVLQCRSAAHGQDAHATAARHAQEHYARMLLPAPTHFRECAKRDEKPVNWLAAERTVSLSLRGKQQRDSLKLTERSGNVYENKGSLCKTWKRGGNVIENKGSYEFNPVMLLKGNDLCNAYFGKTPNLSRCSRSGSVPMFAIGKPASTKGQI